MARFYRPAGGSRRQRNAYHQDVSKAELQRKLRRVLVGLRTMYGDQPGRRATVGAEAPRRTGLDTLVRAMLSQNTNGANARRGYAMLKRRFPTWAQVLAAPVHEVQRQIAICGLARMRARRLQAILRTILDRHGRLSIQHLARQTPEAAFEYLLGFHGIGPKTAALTLLFAFDKPILPVDNGILRVVRRLGLVRRKARDLEAERVLSPLIADGDHRATHVLAYDHAKERCRPKNPKCADCALLPLCPHGQRIVRHRPAEPVAEKAAALTALIRRKAKLSRSPSHGVVRYGDEE